jgi:hypothetical protein
MIALEQCVKLASHSRSNVLLVRVHSKNIESVCEARHALYKSMQINACVAACRNLSPGRLHDLRSASVNNDRLAACAAVHRLHAPLRHFSQRLLADVTAFLDGLRAAAGSVLQRTMQGALTWRSAVGCVVMSCLPPSSVHTCAILHYG